MKKAKKTSKPFIDPGMSLPFTQEQWTSVEDYAKEIGATPGEAIVFFIDEMLAFLKQRKENK